MSLIDFPDVPAFPGVPDLKRSVTGIAARTGLIGILENLDQFGIADQIFGPRWAINAKDGSPIIEPDSVIRFSYRGEEKLATHPVEQGGFAAYNKVAMPYDIQMTLAFGGQRTLASEVVSFANDRSQLTRGEAIKALDKMKGSTDLYEIVTPDFTYPDVNLASYDYRRESNRGVSLLLVDLRFQEVRQTARAGYPPTRRPSGASNVVIGSVKAKEPIVGTPLGEGGVF